MSRLLTSFPSIPPATAEAMVTPWLEIIKRQECGIISFPPRGGAYRRIEQLLGWTKVLKPFFGKNYRKYRLIDFSAFDHVNVSTSDLAKELLIAVGAPNTESVETPKDFISSLAPVFAQSKSISFFVYDTDAWFKESRIDLMLFMSKISQLEPRIQFLLFCEMDVASPKILKLNLGATTLTQNIITVPLYSRSDIEFFIHELELFWKVSIPQKVSSQIIDQIGCHVWLVKEAVRIYLQKNHVPESFLDQPTMRFKLEAIWQQLESDEKEFLAKIASDKPISPFDNPTTRYHLETIGFISRAQETFDLTMPIFNQFVHQKIMQSNFSLSSEKEILLDGEIASHRFGKLEKRALVRLLQKSGQIVKRDDLGKAIWQDPNTNYSDWALDRLISRLRNKVYEFGVNPERLTTVKKVGWLWQ